MQSLTFETTSDTCLLHIDNLIMSYDIILRGGSLVDGTGSPAIQADVAINHNRIAEIGNLADAPATSEIDVSGLVVSPGFIDTHNHSDGWVTQTSGQECKIAQGITTELLMSDGISYAPVNDDTWREWIYYLHSLDGLNMHQYGGWHSLQEYMNFAASRSHQNIITQVPYANVRSLACGWSRNRVDDVQMRAIQREIRVGMEQGATGVSTGLDYVLQCFSDTDELAEACSVLNDFNGIYVTHVRYKKGLIPAINEAIEICTRAGCRLHISHLKGHDPYPPEVVLGRLEEAANDGLDIAFDVYPYQCGSTMLNYLLPYTVWEDGPTAAMKHITAPSFEREFEQILDDYRLDLDKVIIAWTALNDFESSWGQTLNEYVESTGKSTGRALIDLLIDNNLAVLCVVDEGDDHHVHPYLQHPMCMFGTDAIEMPNGKVHPRAFGSSARMIGRMVRDEKLFSLEEAVRKMTSFPAEWFGIEKRGQLKKDWFADLVVFDEQTVIDNATYESPRQNPDGIRLSIVNGAVVYQDGAVIKHDDAPGKYLRCGVE